MTKEQMRLDIRRITLIPDLFVDIIIQVIKVGKLGPASIGDDVVESAQLLNCFLEGEARWVRSSAMLRFPARARGLGQAECQYIP